MSFRHIKDIILIQKLCSSVVSVTMLEDEKAHQILSMKSYLLLIISSLILTVHSFAVELSIGEAKASVLKKCNESKLYTKNGASYVLMAAYGGDRTLEFYSYYCKDEDKHLIITIENDKVESIHYGEGQCDIAKPKTWGARIDEKIVELNL